MQRMTAFMTLMLGVVTIAVLAEFASIATSPVAIEAPGSRNRAVVERYYDAINQMIATGDPYELRQVIDPEAIDLEPAPDGLAGIEGLVRYLQSLRSVFPGIRIEPAGQVFQGPYGIMAQPAVVGYAAASLAGFAIDERQRIWPETERFHIEHSRIVERSFTWSGLVLAGPIQMDDTALAISPRRQLEAGIVVLPPGATLRGVTLETAGFLLPLNVGVLFHLSEAANSSAIAHTASRFGEVVHRAISPGDTETLEPGGVLTVPRGSAYSVLNERSAPAELFLISVSIPLAAADAAALEAQLPFDGLGTHSFVHFESTRRDDWQVEIGLVWLMPGAEISIDPQTRLLAVCEAMSEPPCLIWQPGTDPETRTVASPLMLVSRVSTPDALANLGEGAVLLWVFSVG